MLGCHECWTNTTPISQDLSTTCNQPSVHFYPSKYFNSIQVILYGDTSKCSKLDEEKSWSTISEIWKVIMLTPSWPFLYFMFSSLSTVSSTDTWGVGETITQVSSSQYCVRPWQLLPMMEIGFTLATHWWQPKELFQKYGFTAWKKSVTEMQWQSNWGQTGGNMGATWGQHGGNLKWALAQDWVGESEVWQCLGASSDLQNSRYVPYLPIRSQFWAVRACTEKLPAFKDIRLPSDFPKKSGGEPV